VAEIILLEKEDKIKEEARFDGKWVLRTNISPDNAEVAFT
jgi:hypothetical protein